ncbi:hypothetical protein RUM44_007910, partial [Polyplax serrata]
VGRPLGMTWCCGATPCPPASSPQPMPGQKEKDDRQQNKVSSPRWQEVSDLGGS